MCILIYSKIVLLPPIGARGGTQLLSSYLAQSKIYFRCLITLMCLILWHRHFPWNSAAVWRKNQEGPSSCVVCSKGKQSSNIPTARSTKEPATSPQVVLEIIYTGLSFQSFLFTIYQVISRNAYYINCCERKGWEKISKKFLEEKLSFVCAHVCVCWVLAGVFLHVEAQDWCQESIAVCLIPWSQLSCSN